MVYTKLLFAEPFTTTAVVDERSAKASWPSMPESYHDSGGSAINPRIVAIEVTRLPFSPQSDLRRLTSDLRQWTQRASANASKLARDVELEAAVIDWIAGA